MEEILKKTIIFIILITFITFCFSGCYDANSLESFYYVVALGLDKGDNSNLKLSIQLATSDTNSDSSSSSQSTTSKIYTIDCDSIETGISIFDNFLSKKLDLSHCSTIIFSEELAKEGINSYMGTLANDVEIRPDSYVLISSSTATAVMEKVSNSGENFSSRLYEFIITSTEYTGYSTISEFGNIYYSLNDNLSEAIANYITVSDNIIQSNGIAVFKNDTLTGVLEPTESIAHSIVRNQLENAIVSFENPFDPNYVIDVNITVEKSDINIYIVNQTPYIQVKPKITGKVVSTSENFDYSSEENIKIIENSLNKYLENLINNYLYKISREYNSDICYFGELLATKYLTTEEFNKIGWENIFKDSIFDIEIDSAIDYSFLFNRQE